MVSPSAYWPAQQSMRSSPSSASSSSTLVDAPDAPDALSPVQLSRIVAEKVSPAVVAYVVDRVCDAVDFGLGRTTASSTSSASSAPDSAARRNHTRRWQSGKDASPERDAFRDFVSFLFFRAEVTMSSVLGALVYIDRARPHLSIAIEQWAHHRVLLGALILASKYLNDASLKNAHWALCTNIFGRRDIARIEREFLEVLDFELSVKEEALQQECGHMMRAGVFEQSLEAREREQERERKETSLQAVRALWEEKARLDSKARPVKRQADVDMDVDVDVDVAERRERRRKERRRMEVYLPSARMRVPAPSPATSPDSISPTSSCSTCASVSPDSASSASSPDTDGNGSPYTPPPHNLQYAVPRSTSKHHQSNSSVSYQPLQLLEHFPPVPTFMLTPSRQPVPATLPALQPYPALSLNMPASRPPSTSCGVSPYAPLPSVPVPVFTSLTDITAGAGSRPTTPYSHKRSSAMSMSLYPNFPSAVPVGPTASR